MPTSVYFFPLIGALIGYVTNYLAVRMIFRPRRVVPLGVVNLQGLLPRRKAAFAESIAQAIETHLFSHEDIVKILESPETERALENAVDARLGTLVEGIKEQVPMAGMFLKGNLLDQVREQILRLAKGMLGDVAVHIEDAVDMRETIQNKIEGFDLDQLEQIVLDVARRELRFIEFAGAILGGLVGTAQMLLLL